MNNRFGYFLIALVALTLLFPACQPENQGIVTQPTQKELEPATPVDPFSTDWQSRTKVQQGVLIFENEQDFRNAAAYLHRIGFEEAKSWGESKGFLSQQTMYDDVITAEELNTDKYYAPYDHLNEEELIALNLPKPKHTSEYLELLRKDLIHVDADTDEEHLYSLKLVDASVAPVLNENGLVKVGNILIHYSQNKIKRWIDGELENSDILVLADEDEPTQNIFISDFGSLTKATSYNFGWGVDANGNPNGSWTEYQPFLKKRRRLRYGINGRSTESLATTRTFYVCGSAFNWFGVFAQDIIYQIKVQAQRRKGGTWQYTNNFKPNWGFTSSNWSYTNATIRVDHDNDNNCSLQNYSYSLTPNSGYIGSSYSPKALYGVNNFTYNLDPHGWAVNVYDNDPVYFSQIETGVDMSYTFNVSGDGRTLPTATN